MTSTTATFETDALWISMRVWHPDCWTIRTTEEFEAGILGHGLYGATDGSGYTRLTVYGDTTDEVEAVIDYARDAPEIYAVDEAKHDRHGDRRPTAPGNANRGLLVHRSLSNQISSAFLSRGFVYAEPIAIRDGVEHWEVITGLDRRESRAALDAIRQENDALVEVTAVREATDVPASGTLALGRLSER